MIECYEDLAIGDHDHTVGRRAKLRLEFACPPGELDYYLNMNADYVSTKMIKVYLRGLELT